MKKKIKIILNVGRIVLSINSQLNLKEIIYIMDLKLLTIVRIIHSIYFK